MYMILRIGINARTVPPTCYEGCSRTFQNPQCNAFCVGLAYKNGSCIDPEDVHHPVYLRCCCNPVILYDPPPPPHSP